MRSFVSIAIGLILFHNTATAQSSSLTGTATRSDDATGVIGATTTMPHEFIPMTESEGFRLYLRRAFGPVAIGRAAFAGAIAQSTDSPKEWRGGAEAYGKRVGNSLATHIIAKSLEYGTAELLREDNRYIRSGETGLWKRTKHAVGAAFVARDRGGREHFAYSRFGGVAGGAFISRIWQPRSSNGAGDAATNFGFGMANDIGGNFIHEFWPARKDVQKTH